MDFLTFMSLYESHSWLEMFSVVRETFQIKELKHRHIPLHLKTTEKLLLDDVNTQSHLSDIKHLTWNQMF